MTSPASNEVNPYSSPSVSDPAVRSLDDVVLGEYKPQVFPRDVFDVVLGVILGVLISAFLYGIPLAIAIVFRAPAIGLGGVFVVLLLAIAVMMSGIRSITITETGIKVRRTVRRESAVDWTQVVSIRELSRWEAIIASAIAPHRMCPQCFTCVNYFRIDTADTYFLFPPQNPGAFRATVEFLWSRSKDSAEQST